MMSPFLLLPGRRGRMSSGIAEPPGFLYDLYGTDTQSRGVIPFAVNWPAEPSGSLTPLTVTNNTQLATALATDNAEITVAAGSYNALVLASNNQRWICDDNAIFAGLSGSGFNTVRIDGGQVVTTATAGCWNFTDLILNNMNVECGEFDFGLGSSMFQRLAVIHCTVFSLRYGFFTPGATASDAGSFGSDLILAANYISGGMTVGNSGVEAAIRIQSMRGRVILVDNRARCGFDGQGVKHTYRSHYGNENYWMRRNMTEYGDGIYWQARANNDPVVANNRMGAHWCYDHEIYTTNLSAYGLRAAGGGSIAADWPGAIAADGNAGFTDMTSNDNWIWAAKGGDTIGSNTTAPYQAPPALGSWLAADGLPPGADH